MVRVTDLAKVYENGVRAVEGVSFDVPEGRTLALIGPSGCGKTTILKMLNRMEEPTRGQVSIFGQDILHQDPVQVRRQIGYVMQGGGLFPHWTVERNVGMVPSFCGWDRWRILQRVTELLQLVELAPEKYRHRYPSQLSGGERQRVGIARALAADPPLILLDEPFAALDPITRHQLQREFVRLREVVRKTMVLVSHDLKEAFLLGDEVMLLHAGRVQQHGSPEQLRSQPATPFVATFLESELS